jgi:hypothetical protein
VGWPLGWKAGFANMDELQGGGDVGRAEAGDQEEAATCGEGNSSRDLADTEGNNLMEVNPEGEGKSDSEEEEEATTDRPDVAEGNEKADRGGQGIAEEAAAEGSNSPAVDLTFDSSAIAEFMVASEAYLIQLFGEAASNQDSEEVRFTGFRVAAGLLAPPLHSSLPAWFPDEERGVMVACWARTNKAIFSLPHPPPLDRVQVTLGVQMVCAEM